MPMLRVKERRVEVFPCRSIRMVCVPRLPETARQTAPAPARPQDVWMGVYLPNAMFHDVSIIPMVNMFLFFLGGAVMSLTPWVVHLTKPERLKLWVPDHELAATH